MYGNGFYGLSRENHIKSLISNESQVIKCIDKTRRDVLYFNTFDELKHYWSCEDCVSAPEVIEKVWKEEEIELEIKFLRDGKED